MKIGVFTVLMAKQPLNDVLEYVAGLGCQAVELGTGNYPGNDHCDPKALLEDKEARTRLFEEVRSRGLEISALSCHGNPLHPDGDFARKDREVFRSTVRLAHEYRVENVVCFSGCPGGGPSDTTPNWVTCAWPPDFSETLKWQWNDVAIPYWQEEAKFANDLGIRICLEMHPGFVVYNTETLLRLREACGDNLGANFDPSHLPWQGMDPVTCIRKLGDAIFHFHAKDSRVDPANAALNGVLDTKPYSDEAHRSWIFRTVGFGHSMSEWRNIISALRLVGYDGALSIEHEDSLMSAKEGFEKAVHALSRMIIVEAPGPMTWA